MSRESKRKEAVRNTDFIKSYWSIFGLLLVLLAFYSFNRSFDNDEFETIHSSWKLLQGEKIYVDFLQHHHPFLYYLLIPVLAVLGETTVSVIASRISVFFMLLLIFMITYHIGLKISGKETGVIALVLLSTTLIFIRKAIEIRPDVPETLFSLLSIFLLLGYFENNNPRHLILSSVSLGVAFLFSLKAVFLVFLMGGLLLIGACMNHIRYRDLLVYFSVFLLSLLPYFSYLLCTGSLSSYFMFNWLLNMKFIYHFSIFPALKLTCKVNPIVWAFYGLGLAFFMKTPNQKRVGALSLGLLLSVFLARGPWDQYFMKAIPLVAVISAYAIYSILRNKRGVMIALLVISLIYPSWYLAKETTRSSSRQLKKIDYVLSLTDSEDYVYDGHILFNVFRKDLDFFWHNVAPRGALETYRLMVDYEYDILELIDKFKPKVISNYAIRNMQDERITGHYVQSDRYKDLFVRIDSAGPDEIRFLQLFRQKKFQKALDVALKLQKESAGAVPRVLNNIGLCYYKLGRFREAEEYYQKALKIQPNYDKAYSNLSLLYGKMNRLDLAIECAEKSLAISPENPPLRKRLTRYSRLKASGPPPKVE